MTRRVGEDSHQLPSSFSMAMKRYQLSPHWVLRKDEHYIAVYSLFAICEGYEYIINHSIYSFLSFIEKEGRSIEEMEYFFGQDGIDYHQLIETFNNQWRDIILQHDEPVASLSSPSLNFSPKIPICSSPKTIEVQLTTKCNLECLHCVHSCGHKGSNLILSGKDWIDILLKLERNRVQKVVLTGGEFFTHPDIDEIIEAIGGMRMRFIILTNAMLITPKRAALLNKPHILLSISLDGSTEQSHDFLRGRGAYSILMEKMQLLSRHDVVRILSVTLHAANRNDIQGIIDYALKEKIRALNFTILDEVGRAKENKILHMTSTERAECKRQIRESQKTYKKELPISLLDPTEGLFQYSNSINDVDPIYCTGSTSHMAIDPKGDVYPCVYAFGEESLCAGSLKERTLNDVWNTSRWILLRGSIFMRDLYQCKTCDLKKSCQTKNCRVRALKYKKDIYAAPNCIVYNN